MPHDNPEDMQDTSAASDNSNGNSSSSSSPSASSSTSINLGKRSRSDEIDIQQSRPENPQKKTRYASPDSYMLLHTLGATAPDPHGGDGAYAEWLDNYFKAEVAKKERGAADVSCVGVERLIFKQGGTGLDKKVDPMVKKDFVGQFDEILKKTPVGSAGTIILDWHVRATGMPNGWTGRGASNGLLSTLEEHAKNNGFNFELMYTVHEITGAAKRIKKTESSNPFPYLLALNPTVKEGLATSFPREGQVHESQVPMLMESLHTSSLERILSYAVGSDVVDEQSLSLATAGTCILQKLRFSNFMTHETARVHGQSSASSSSSSATSGGLPAGHSQNGILIFGMISERHGVSMQNIQTLAAKLEGFPSNFHIAIAGKESDKGLVTNLRSIGSRVKVIGEIQKNSLDEFAGYKYALSMDAQGYRPNASAMVNVTAAGKLLFSRNASEETNALIERAIGKIKECEQYNGQWRTEPDKPNIGRRFTDALQPSYHRVLESSANVVGRRLNTIFKNIAKASYSK